MWGGVRVGGTGTLFAFAEEVFANTTIFFFFFSNLLFYNEVSVFCFPLFPCSSQQRDTILGDAVGRDCCRRQLRARVDDDFLFQQLVHDSLHFNRWRRVQRNHRRAGAICALLFRYCISSRRNMKMHILAV